MNFNDREEFAQHDFRHALVESIAIGTRRDLVLTIRKLVWIQQFGQRTAPIYLRCGGVGNLDECLAFFALAVPCEMAEIVVVSSRKNAAILKATEEQSGNIFLIRCRNFSFLET